MLAQYRRSIAATLRGGCLTALAACGLWQASVAQAAAPGTVIRNDATLSALAVPTVQASVSVRVGSVTFLRYASGGAALPAASESVPVQPVLCGGALLSVPAYGNAGGAGDLPTLPSTYPLEAATRYRVGEPVFLRVSDPAANLSPGGRDLVTVVLHADLTGDTETLQLQETATNSGEFAGFINTTRDPAVADCRLSVTEADQVYADYRSERTDRVDLVDPYGVAFDATSGALLDGATVTLVDDLTGLPATVVGDAGEPYPATVVTGSTFSTGARTYALRPGEYRFPFVAPGRSYRLLATRSNYVFPTSRPDSHFATPAFAGFVVATGSRGEPFLPPGGLPLRLDLPLDAVSSGLLLVKNTPRTIAAIGDFVPYDVVASNRSGGTLVGVRLSDALPPGFRLVPGSLRQDGVAMPDPQVSPDGRTLTHTIPVLANGADVRVTYVVEVTAATPLGDAVNSARAGNAVVQSNEARAIVRVREDLMRARALVAGRVLETAGCDAADLARARPVAGARIYLEDGRYVVTDSRGRWHVDDLRPGTHVLQLDSKGLPPGVDMLACGHDTRSAGTAFSRFVDLQGGTLWQEDFLVRRAGSLHVRMEELKRQVSVRLSSETAPEGLRHALAIAHLGTPLDGGTVSVLMPPDLVLVPGSLRLGDIALPDPPRDDKGWRLALPALPAAAESRLEWTVAQAPGARPGEHSLLVQLGATVQGVPLDFDMLENRAAVTVPERLGRVIIFRPRFGSFSTELAPADKRWLDDISTELRDAGEIRLEIVGHTDDVRVVPRKGRAINDNYQLSLARAQSVAAYLQRKLGLADDRIQAFGKGPDEPLEDNKTPKGRDANRRVELKVYAQGAASAARLEVARGGSAELRQEWTEWQAVTTEEAVGEGAATAAPAPEDIAVGLLSHRDGEVVADRVQALRVRVDSRLKTTITLDGAPIPEDRLGFRKDEGKTTLMSFVGVDLGEPGPHVLHVRGVDPFGIARLDQRVTVVVASAITRIRAAQSPANVADGRSPVVVKVELVDASGRVAPAAVDLRLVDAAGLRPWVTSDSQRALADSAGKIPVGADGLMKFAPVTRSGLYTIEVAYNNAVEKIPVYVRPEQREWILVGLAEGSLAARSISGNQQSAAAAGASDDLWQDGRLAFFAKGQIQGKWLLTMAYDSNRDRAGAFAGAIDPERFYTLYADAADPRYDAASKEKLYLRIERDAFYALFGDFDTGMTEVELARYSRAMTGLKTEYHDQRFDLNFFAADTGRGYGKDELRGDGTSGLYRLSRRPLLAGSEKVRIETRDRFRSEVVLSAQHLTRWADYNIDYDRGEIFFKSPVRSQDDSLNPMWIVVEYESEQAGGDALNAGGRAAVKFAGGRATLGVSTVQEENGINGGELNALDASVRVTPADTLRLELADSAQTGLLPRAGSAQLLEWKHDSQRIKGRAYVREQEGGFGLGQQALTEEGTRKVGVEGRYQWQAHTALTADVYRQEMIVSGASRQVADLRGEVSHDRYGYGIGLRHVDESLPNEDRGAEQLTLNGRYTLPGNRVKVRGALETAFLANSESMDFPDRLLLGADWQLHRKVQFSLEQEWASSELRETENTRFGVQVQPWRGAKASTLLDRESSESGQRLRAGLGLGQNLVLSPEWTADFGYDRAETLADTAGAAPLNPQLPPTFGGTATDFWAASAGANYRHEDRKGVGRIERREADDEFRWNVVGGFYRELNPEIAMAVGLEATLSDRVTGDEDSDVLLRGSLAWRPDDSRWIVLDRLDLGVERLSNASGAFNGRRLVNNLNANHRRDRHQVSLQYGSKFVLDTIDAARYSGYTDLVGIEWRHDLSPRWDIGWRNSILHSWTPGVMDYQYGIAVGMTPVKNAWVSLGYNVEGFFDADFSAGEYTAQGLYLKMRLKVDQHSIRQIWNDARGVFGRQGGSDKPEVATAPGPVEAAVEEPAAPAAAPAPRPEAAGSALDALATGPAPTTAVLPAASADEPSSDAQSAAAPAPVSPVVAPAALPAAAPAVPPAAAAGARIAAPAVSAPLIAAPVVAAPANAGPALRVPAAPRAGRRPQAPKAATPAPAARATVAPPGPVKAPPAGAAPGAPVRSPAPPAAVAEAATVTAPSAAPRVLTPERKTLIRQRARARRDLEEMKAKERARQEAENPQLRPGERQRRRERLQRNERKVKKLIDEKAASPSP